MTERKWTPGPWVVSGGDLHRVDGADDEAIASFYMDTSDADAHLISAAPDLYEALERFWEGECFRGCSHEDAEMINAALAKARGES